MKIYRGNTEIYDVFLRDSSYTEEEINAGFMAQIVFDTLNPVNLTIRDKIVANGNNYYIRYKEKVEKKETSLGYSYTVLLYHEMYFLHDVVFSQYEQIEFKKHTSTYTGTANDILQLVVNSMNRAGYNWSVGESIQTESKTFDFKDKTCAEVVSDVISQFNTEFWVEGQTLNFGKREFSSNGIVLSQGAGFKNLTLESVDDTPPVTRLYAYGGSTNMTGTDFLMLPGGKLYLEKNTDKYGVIEAIIQLEDIFPKGEFYVTAVSDQFTFQANGIDFDISAHLIDGVTVLITFQTGALAGYDLTIEADEQGNPTGWNFSTKTIKVNKIKEENALEVPGDINFAVGDKFILTGIKMPQSYIDEAAERLEDETQDLLDSKCENRVQLNAVCDEIEFADRDISIACGQMIGVYSEELDIDREIRVTKVRRYIENNDEISYRYEITLSDFLSTSWAGKVIEEIKKVPEMIEREVNPVSGFTKRTWQDVQETKAMMYDPESQFWTDILSAIVGEFGQLIVGFNSAQMDFNGVRFQPNYNNNYNRFNNTAGTLIHQTINNDGTTHTWNISSGAIALTDTAPYYIYAKCSVDGSNGTIVASKTPIKVNQEAGWYHFWIGTLNSPRTDTGITTRSWKPVYGFTEISGSDIVTGVIRDRLSRLIIDLVNGTIYGAVTFAPGSIGYNNIEDTPDLSVYDEGIFEAKLEAENAMNLADKKMRVFRSRPTTPYYAGDIWVNADKNGGVDILVCTTSRISGSYNANDWGTASNYDNTQVRIDNGIVTAGRIQLAGNAGAILAGIAGDGITSASVRVWAGGTYANRGSANFRVLQDGSVYTKNSFYVEDQSGQVNGGFSSSGTTDSSVRFWIGGANKDNANLRIEGSGDFFAFRIYAGSTRADSCAITKELIALGDPSVPPIGTGFDENRFGRNIRIYSNSNYPPLFAMVTGENSTTPFFEIRGRKYGSEWFNRTLIRAAWLPPYAMIQSLFGGTVDGRTLKYDVNSGAIYFE